MQALSNQYYTLLRVTVLLLALSVLHCPVWADEVPQETQQALARALDKERDARATYAAVMEKFGRIRPFKNIILGEEKHIETIEELYQDLGLDVPGEPSAEKDIPVPQTVIEALKAAIASEERKVAMYDEMLEGMENEEVRAAFETLQQTARERHLRSFRRHLARLDPDYQPPAENDGSAEGSEGSHEGSGQDHQEGSHEGSAMGTEGAAPDEADKAVPSCCATPSESTSPEATHSEE